jgi:16S rRNA (cytidine1402-2'-O)-methyltransferase
MKLFLIPCPIAENTASQTLPAEIRDTILHCNHFLVENTRTARRFISELKLGIKIEDLVFYELTKDSKLGDVKKILQGLKSSNCKWVGVISEAGCPGVADPGALAVQLAHQMNIEVEPLVGPSSILLALMASGFSGQSFVFHGYLPIEKPNRIKKIEQLEKEVIKTGQTQIFMETPYRNNAILEDLLQTCHPESLLSISADLKGEDSFSKTLSIQQWKSQIPDLHKKPTIFLLGR